jgi:hypothetical protein
VGIRCVTRCRCVQCLSNVSVTANSEVQGFRSMDQGWAGLGVAIYCRRR